MGDPNNVVQFDGFTTKELSAPDILRAIADTGPKNVFVICWPEDGTMPSYHSSTGDAPVVLMRLREFEHKYFNGEFCAQEETEEE